MSSSLHGQYYFSMYEYIIALIVLLEYSIFHLIDF